VPGGRRASLRSPGKDFDKLIPQNSPRNDGESVPGPDRLIGPQEKGGEDCFLVGGIDLDITDTTDFNPRLTHRGAYVDGPNIIKLDGIKLAAAKVHFIHQEIKENESSQGSYEEKDESNVFPNTLAHGG
jgi:hypothetical protein